MEKRATVTREIFFASGNGLYAQFEYADDREDVVIDLTAHIWGPPPGTSFAAGSGHA